MIDTGTHYRMHLAVSQIFPNNIPGNSSSCTISDSPDFDPWPLKISTSDNLKDDAAMLLPKIVKGFEIEAKRWKTLNIKQIEPVKWNKKAFERLVLDDQSKELINALVSVHLSAKKAGDIIAGKGNGLIILLHGSPGVGKTLTAGMSHLRSILLSIILMQLTER